MRVGRRLLLCRRLVLIHNVRITSHPKCIHLAVSRPFRRSGQPKLPGSRVLGSYLREGVNFRSYDEQTRKPRDIPPHRQRHLSRFGNVHHPCTRASDAHPCTAPCARRRRQTTQCDSRIGFNLPSVLHRPVHTVRQRLVHSQRQLATAVQPIAARTSTAACATVEQVSHTFSSPPASAVAFI
jgi:hypothetical protein